MNSLTSINSWKVVIYFFFFLKSHFHIHENQMGITYSPKSISIKYSKENVKSLIKACINSPCLHCATYRIKHLKSLQCLAFFCFRIIFYYKSLFISFHFFFHSNLIKKLNYSPFLQFHDFQQFKI